MTHTTSDARKLLQRVYEEIWNKGDLAAADEIFERPDGVKRYNAGFQAGVPDIFHTVEEILLEGDRAAVKWTARGTHTGELFGIPATGRSFTYEGITRFHLRDGKVAEHATLWDALGFLEQLGLVPLIRKPDGSKL